MTDRPPARSRPGPRIGSLCTGYGGLDLAVELVLGGQLAWYAETDRHACTVLAHHWPGVAQPRRHPHRRLDRVEPVDVLTAGFPCQDISNAGKRAGITGEHSSLWTAVADAVRVLRPRLVFVENVAALLRRGFDVVHADLAAIGYDTSWLCLRASDVGAAHRRDRVFLLYLDSLATLWPTSHLVAVTTSGAGLVRVDGQGALLVDDATVVMRIYQGSAGGLGPVLPQSVGFEESRGMVGAEFPVDVQKRSERPWLVVSELSLGQVAVEVLLSRAASCGVPKLASAKQYPWPAYTSSLASSSAPTRSRSAVRRVRPASTAPVRRARHSPSSSTPSSCVVA